MRGSGSLFGKKKVAKSSDLNTLLSPHYKREDGWNG